ncbi:hypothetical protein N7462_001495 [Penicillium macrosclerotiorum]|uniref:uncharacterized protein n=1 Tax=Penicillium macrosclerotiorum TaxID=303699 RepID=UPI0025495041|nr:uncharacterized protein N7462_001495 [Penicillium macrosclerotiorum]KAJ5692072.1 hypothetical protein N7462_001495 [Penicillium macrosclerotiorum]
MSTSAVTSLYRRSLKLSLDWAVHRSVWRGQAVYIRSLFDANKDVRDPRQQQVLLRETEKLLENWKHPDPYRPPTAPGGMFRNLIFVRFKATQLTRTTGNKWERNLPAPILPCMF